MESEGRIIHGLAEQAREKGQFLIALELTDRALASYQEDGDPLGISEVLSSRFLTLRHLADKTKDRNFLILAAKTVEAAVEIAENSGVKEALALPYFNLAKALEALGKFEGAVEAYRKAIEAMEQYPPERHNRPGVTADMRTHLAVCEYRAGDKSALQRAEAALAELAGSDEEHYNKDVWMSGGLMKLAEAVAGEDRERAGGYLDRAREIIEANPELTIRKKQLQELEERLGQGGVVA